MVFNPTLEEQLTIERQARAAFSGGSEQQVGELCASLIKENLAKQTLLNQALARIIELETAGECLQST